MFENTPGDSADKGAMASRFARLRRIARDERGFTLPELLTSIAIFGFLMAGLLGLLDAGAKHAPREQERAHVIHDTEVGLGRMVRELRQAYAFEGGGPNFIRVDVRRRGTNTNLLVEYDCGNANPGKCVRRATTAGGALPASGETIIPMVLNSSTGNAVFVYSDPVRPLYVTVRIEAPASGERPKSGHTHTVVYEDGFHIRNLSN